MRFNVYFTEGYSLSFTNYNNHVSLGIEKHSDFNNLKYLVLVQINTYIYLSFITYIIYHYGKNIIIFNITHK